MLSCLIVEDEPLIRLDLEELIAAAGYDVLTADTDVSAMDILARRRPTVALIDITLRGAPCVALAVELKRLKVPFAVHSGHVRRAETPPVFRDAPWLPKPADPRVVIDLLRRLAG